MNLNNNSIQYKYSCRDTWEAIREKLPPHEWRGLIWFSYAILRQSIFFSWLAFHDSFSIGDRLLKWGFSGEMKFWFNKSIIMSAFDTAIS
jgi:hypothetical protein